MGRFMRKRRKVSEVSVIKLAENVAAVKGSDAGKLRIACGRMSRRRLTIMQHSSRLGKSCVEKLCRSIERHRISRWSGFYSSKAEEASDFRYTSVAEGVDKAHDNYTMSTHRLDCSTARDRSEITLSSILQTCSAEKESMSEIKSRPLESPLALPSPADIEEFFVEAEKSQKQQFAVKYNFNVDSEVPLEGRYDWIRIAT
ncbi:hypothetical protein HPP92_015822 [Vanilla planifolia]|uniref:Cyclin-dependent kinase inhibitor n=1 Tax=Vanilla planifolia TaxID=51239 RepID=A0A835PD07_VANPL|nr:hypothetical protein HPP92_027221 [Vanilla planifolia]KAG0471276.1 hypothetical protein HPP92_015822 [Vanilla planifolia]